MRLFTVESIEPKKPPASKLKKAFGIFLVITAAVIVAAGAVFVRALPRMSKIIASAARNKASAEINAAIMNYMDKNDITYGRLVEMHFDDSGAITSVTADTAKIDVLIARMDDEIGNELEEKLMETSIPLNVLLGTDIIAGAGPWLRVHFYPLDIVNVNVRHEFESQGINQTLYTIYLDITVNIEVMLPMKNRIESVDTSIPIGHTLIVGGVPTTYVER